MPGRNGVQARRSSRVSLRVPLRIFEPGTNKRFTIGEAYAVKVSLWGGLVALQGPINRGQKLLLVNESTGESAESHVVYMGAANPNRKLIGVEFLQSSPSFWGLNFPPPVSRRSSPADAPHTPAN